MGDGTLPGIRITLHVLRHPPSERSAAEGTRRIAHPVGPLREAMDRADREHRGVLAEVKEMFYYGNVTPTVLKIRRQTADQLRSFLGLREAVHGVWGPETIQHSGALYAIWIQDQLCG